MLGSRANPKAKRRFVFRELNLDDCNLGKGHAHNCRDFLHGHKEQKS